MTPRGCEREQAGGADKEGTTVKEKRRGGGCYGERGPADGVASRGPRRGPGSSTDDAPGAPGWGRSFLVRRGLMSTSSSDHCNSNRHDTIATDRYA